jgi:hypothetical protein
MAAGSGSIGQQQCEPQHPAVDRHVVNLNSAFCQQFFDIAVRQREAQVPADREDDDLW